MEKCEFRHSCKKYKTSSCNIKCFPFIFLHGPNMEGGEWGSLNVPGRYSKARKNSLLAMSADNAEIKASLIRYIDKVVELVLNKGVGLYLWGGTGVGKTTIAAAILNEFVIARCKLHLKKEVLISRPVGYFVRLSDFQNTYGAQFRGTSDMQEKAASKYYAVKDKLKTAELLVVDDIALRDTTEGFRNELYEIIDYRLNETGATIFTSNIALNELSMYVGDRIASRVEGMTVPINVKGVDRRKEGLF